MQHFEDTPLPAATAHDHDQLHAVLQLLQSVLGADLLGVYLHGSWVAGGLQPHSDIDVLAVTGQSLTQTQRRALTEALLALSAPYPAPIAGPRCLELVVCDTQTVDSWPWPTPVDYLYGEWLRTELEAGALPQAHGDAEYCLLLTQAREQALPLYGPELQQLLPPLLPTQQQRALRELIPTLRAGLLDDTRNVLLTLARMAYTAQCGGFISKDAAARWVTPTLAPAHAALLEHARQAYLGLENDLFEPPEAVAALADELIKQILAER